MAREYIEREDLLNTGREKLNRSIDKSYDANEKSDKALSDANRLGNQSIAIAKESEEISKESNLIAKDTNDRMNDIISGTTNEQEIIDARKPLGLEKAKTLNERLNMQFGKNDDFRPEDISIINKMKNEFSERGINVSWFGAKGDSKTDDTYSIEKAFEYAKSNNLNIFFENKKYIYNPTKTIEFNKSVEFGNSELIRNDGVNTNIPILKLVHSSELINIDINKVTTELNSKTIKIPELSGYGNAYVQLYDENTLTFKRYGVQNDKGEGVPKFDHFSIDNDGYLTTKITLDFSNVTKITIQPANDEWITVKGGKFISEVDVSSTHNYFKNGIEINRSNVILENVYHDLSKNVLTSARSGFVNVHDCMNIIVKNSKLQPLKYKDYGTYDFNPEKVLNITIDNMQAQSYTDELWGVMGGNFLKNVLVVNSKMSRFDAHMGITNLTIRDSEIGRGGVQVCGYGTMVLDNVEIYSRNVIQLRTDYGAFWNGSITMKNIKHHRTKDEEMNILYAERNYDFNYTDDVASLSLCNSLAINNYQLDNHNISTTGSNHLSAIIKPLQRKTGDGSIKNEYRFPNKIICENISFDNSLNDDSGFYFLADVNSWLFKSSKKTRLYSSGQFDTNTEVILDSIDFADFSGVDWRSNLFVYGATDPLGTNGDDNYADDLNRIFWNITIKNSKKLHASTLGRYVKLNIFNSDVYFCLAFQKGCRSWLNFVNCRITPRVASENSIAFKARYDRWYFTNCYFDQTFIGKTNNVVDNPFKSVLQDLMSFATAKGQPIVPTSSMSSCNLTSHVNLGSLKTDLSDLNFKFGNWVPYQVFHPIKGDNNSVPKNNLYGGLQYYNTTYHRLQIFDGSAWRDASGNPV